MWIAITLLPDALFCSFEGYSTVLASVIGLNKVID
jgi:hypothetical protein